MDVTEQEQVYGWGNGIENGLARDGVTIVSGADLSADGSAMAPDQLLNGKITQPTDLPDTTQGSSLTPYQAFLTKLTPFATPPDDTEQDMEEHTRCRGSPGPSQRERPPNTANTDEDPCVGEHQLGTREDHMQRRINRLEDMMASDQVAWIWKEKEWNDLISTTRSQCEELLQQLKKALYEKKQAITAMSEMKAELDIEKSMHREVTEFLREQTQTNGRREEKAALLAFEREQAQLGEKAAQQEAEFLRTQLVQQREECVREIASLKEQLEQLRNSHNTAMQEKEAAAKQCDEAAGRIQMLESELELLREQRTPQILDSRAAGDSFEYHVVCEGSGSSDGTWESESFLVANGAGQAIINYQRAQYVDRVTAYPTCVSTDMVEGHPIAERCCARTPEADELTMAPTCPSAPKSRKLFLEKTATSLLDWPDHRDDLPHVSAEGIEFDEQGDPSVLKPVNGPRSKPRTLPPRSSKGRPVDRFEAKPASGRRVESRTKSKVAGQFDHDEERDIVEAAISDLEARDAAIAAAIAYDSKRRHRPPERFEAGPASSRAFGFFHPAEASAKRTFEKMSHEPKNQRAIRKPARQPKRLRTKRERND